MWRGTVSSHSREFHALKRSRRVLRNLLNDDACRAQEGRQVEGPLRQGRECA